MTKMNHSAMEVYRTANERAGFQVREAAGDERTVALLDKPAVPLRTREK